MPRSRCVVGALFSLDRRLAESFVLVQGWAKRPKVPAMGVDGPVAGVHM